MSYNIDPRQLKETSTLLVVYVNDILPFEFIVTYLKYIQYSDTIYNDIIT